MMPHLSCLRDLLRTCAALADEGWAEANAGNVSLRLPPEEVSEEASPGPWTALALPVPSLARSRFAITAAGSQLRNVPLDPAHGCGVIELDESGANWRVLWGLEGARPTSELLPHLRSHAVRMEKSGGKECALVHTHPAHLVALCHLREWDTRSLTRLLWGMHPEAVCLFPGGLAYAPFAISGTEELTRLTCEALEKHPMVLWEHHGVFASGESLDHAYGMVQAAEKAATIYRIACEMGGVARTLEEKELRALIEHFHLEVGPGILEI